MILHYHLSGGKPEAVEVFTFADFKEWLASMDVGGDNPSPKSLEEFSEAFEEMSSTGKARILFAKPFDEKEEALVIDGVEP